MYNSSLKILRLLPPELSHTITINFLKYFRLRQKSIEDSILTQHLMGLDFALNYYEDFILPKKKFLEIDSSNKEVFIDIINVLENEVTENSSSEDIQTLLYEVGKKHEFENLKDFFKLVYQVILGQDQGPRLGSFFKLFGLRETIDYLKKLIDN